MAVCVVSLEDPGRDGPGEVGQPGLDSLPAGLQTLQDVQTPRVRLSVVVGHVDGQRGQYLGVVEEDPTICATRASISSLRTALAVQFFFRCARDPWVFKL